MAVSIKIIRGGEEKGMDFSNRSSQPQSVAPNAQSAAPVNSVNGGGRKAPVDQKTGKLFKVASGVLLVAVIVLIVALVAYIGFGGGANEEKYIQKNRLQAVFLNTGQVYFGNITSLNSKYYVLKDIYYLQTSSNSSSASSSNAQTSVSLVKLGCELHAPYDQMVINSTEVTFWENLQPTGQVAKAVATFQKNNPNGQKCSDQSAAPAGTSSTGTVQGSTPAGTSTGTSTGTTTTKP